MMPSVNSADDEKKMAHRESIAIVGAGALRVDLGRTNDIR
jgi:hypothetical protein